MMNWFQPIKNYYPRLEAAGDDALIDVLN